MNDRKTGFPSVSNEETEILILGTFPGEMSLKMGEYYAHPRNCFWKIIAKITSENLPENYDRKKQLLLKHKIGVWDVIHQVERRGSLDKNILNEIPNNLDKFISKHSHLRVIGFNGKTAEKIYKKYFKKQENIKYTVLPSTSPANTRSNFDEKCRRWGEIFES